MKAPKAVALCAVVAIALGLTATPATAGSSDEKLDATEIGITEDEIRIAVVADVENQLAPGLFQSVPDAVEGFAKYINRQGGLAGRKLVVDFIDSHLNADESRNALIKACSEDFATIATSALFLNNVDDATGCVDKEGEATGLPDLPIIAIEVVQQCSPISFPVNAPQLLCSTKDDHPQTWRANQGTIKYYERSGHRNLHGISLITNDLKSAQVAATVLARGVQSAGVKNDGEELVSARATQSAFTPFVQQMKDAGSNYALDGGPAGVMVALRKEAQLQGLDSDEIVWDCFSQCYDQALIEQGGADVDGQYATLSQLPFEEAKQNKALANYIRFVGKENINGYGSYAWVASMLFRDAVNAVVAKSGNNGLTRAALLEALGSIHNFDADGMWGTTDVAGRVPTPCFMVTQVQDGEFVRVHPKKKGTLDCKKSNRIEMEEDLL